MTEQKMQRFSIANTLTISRIVLVPVFMVLLLSPWPLWMKAPTIITQIQPWIAAFIYTLLAATDGLDGYLARSRNEVTTFGKFLDPLADKILVTAALLALIQLGTLPAWIALVILSREFIVSGIRMVSSVEGIVIAASWYGKIKTVVTIVAVVMFLVKDSPLISDLLGDGIAHAFSILSWIVMIAAVILTIVSMVDYFVRAGATLVGPWKNDSEE